MHAGRLVFRRIARRLRRCGAFFLKFTGMGESIFSFVTRRFNCLIPFNFDFVKFSTLTFEEHKVVFNDDFVTGELEVFFRFKNPDGLKRFLFSTKQTTIAMRILRRNFQQKNHFRLIFISIILFSLVLTFEHIVEHKTAKA